MRSRVLLASLAAVVALAGCSTDKVVSSSELEKQITPVVTQKTGSKPESLTCQKLKAKVGATTTCKVKISGQTITLKVTATKVDGSNVKFDIAQQ